MLTVIGEDFYYYWILKDFSSIIIISSFSLLNDIFTIKKRYVKNLIITPYTLNFNRVEPLYFDPERIQCH